MQITYNRLNGDSNVFDVSRGNCEYLWKIRRTIYRYIQPGDCPPYIRITNKNIKFDKKDMDAWLESKKIQPQKTENRENSDV